MVDPVERSLKKRKTNKYILYADQIVKPFPKRDDHYLQYIRGTFKTSNLCESDLNMLLWSSVGAPPCPKNICEFHGQA